MVYIDDATHMGFPASEIHADDVLLNITGASIGRSAIAVPELAGGNVNQHVCEIRLKRGVMDPHFVSAVLNSPIGQDQISSFQAGGNRQGLNFSQVGSIRVPALNFRQQQAIAAVIGDVDRLIATVQGKVAKKRAIKQGLAQTLLTGAIRLPGFSGRWRVRRLSELLAYEQPGRYLVGTTAHLDSGLYPVLTAGKTLILGYTNETEGVYREHPAVIFDDFTTSSQYVDYDFKVKSSAIKILTPRENVNLRFIYERMQILDFQLGDHKRYWISEYGHQTVAVPGRREQDAIAQVLVDVDRELSALVEKLTKACRVKEGMMQELLSGRTVLPVESMSA